MRNFSPVPEMKKVGTSSGAKFVKQSNRGETQSYNFCAYRSFGNSYSCITAVKWEAVQWAKQQDAIWAVEFLPLSSR